MKYLWVTVQLQFRIPVSIFFSLLFPLIMMFAMVTSYGNFDIGNGYHFIDKYFLISTGMGMMPLSLISFPIWLGESFQNKSYKRLEYFGLSIPQMVLADVFSYILLTGLCIGVNILFGFLFYRLHIPNITYLLVYVAQCLYGNFGLLLLGSILAVVIKNTRILMPIGMTLLFGSYILTGAFSSFSALPKIFQEVGKWLPMKYVMNDFYDIWIEKEMFSTGFFLVNTVFVVGLSLFLLFFLSRKSICEK